jgi:hypothetical protein
MTKWFILFSLFSSVCFAQTPITKGEAAPEDGLFLTKQEAAQMIADREATKEKHKLELDNQKQQLEAKFEGDKKILDLKLNIEKEKNSAIIAIKEQQINNLYKELENEWEISGIWWLGGGIAIGTVSSIAIFFAATQIQQTPSLLAGQ